MDISEINDTVMLKAMAYDQIAAKENADRNLQMINQRITQIESTPAEAPATPSVEPTAAVPDATQAETETPSTSETPATTEA